MKEIFEEVMQYLLLKVPNVRYINWDIGQLDGYYLKPSITYPGVLISFPQVQYDSLGDGLQMGDMIMQLKIVTSSLSSTSNIAPVQVRTKGNEIYAIEKQIFKALHGADGNSYNSMARLSHNTEVREDGLNVLNVQYTFIAEDETAVPATHIISPMGVIVETQMLQANAGNFATNNKYQIADYANFFDEAFLTNFALSGKFQYGFRCKSASANNVPYAAGQIILFPNPSITNARIQTAPNITMPANVQGTVMIDENWINFLQSLPITHDITFDYSPFAVGTSAAYPQVQIKGVPTIVDPLTGWPLNGTGFSMLFKQGLKFSFTIEFLVIDESGNEYIVGTITYRDDHYIIQNNLAQAANITTYQL
jgi:hypothetical protein